MQLGWDVIVPPPKPKKLLKYPHNLKNDRNTLETLKLLKYF